MNSIGFVLGGASVPLVSLICGIILWKAPPARNAFFGYRSKISMQSEQMWYFAQTIAGKRMTAVCAPTVIVFVAVCVFVAVNKYNGDVKFWTLIAIVIISVLELAAVNISVGRSLKSADKRG